LGDKAREVWRDLLKVNPYATDDRLQLAEALGKPGAAEGQVLLKSVLESRSSSYAQQAEAARIGGKTGAVGLNLGSAELRFVASLEGWRSQPKPTTPAPALPALQATYYAPIYAAGATSSGVALPPLDNLRRALYLHPLSRSQKNEPESRLFAGLIRAFDRAKRPGLLVDLFEQHGGGYPRLVERAASQHRGETESGNPLEEPDQELTGPLPLTTLTLSPIEKVTLMKLVIAAYGTLQADDLAAQHARNSAALLTSSRQALLAQAKQLEEKAQRSAKALAERFSVNDTLGEELSRRKPVSRPRRERVRS
jgi:hypothetical protein